MTQHKSSNTRVRGDPAWPGGTKQRNRHIADDADNLKAGSWVHRGHRRVDLAVAGGRAMTQTHSGCGTSAQEWWEATEDIRETVKSSAASRNPLGCTVRTERGQEESPRAQ